MVNQKEVGEKGEEVALNYLLENGYEILEKNWHFGHLELDIIAKEGNELVIVEVKSRTGTPYEFPADALPPKKMNMIIEAADGYLQLNELSIETRFDLITVIFYGDDFVLEHFKEAFAPGI